MPGPTRSMRDSILGQVAGREHPADKEILRSASLWAVQGNVGGGPSENLGRTFDSRNQG